VVAAEAAAVEAANPTPAAPQKPAVAVGHDPNMALSRRAVEAEVAGQVGRHDAVEAESGVGELVFADEKGEVTVTVRACPPPPSIYGSAGTTRPARLRARARVRARARAIARARVSVRFKAGTSLGQGQG
jgi:hypothetical protein